MFYRLRAWLHWKFVCKMVMDLIPLVKGIQGNDTFNIMGISEEELVEYLPEATNTLLHNKELAKMYIMTIKTGKVG